jgi:hypothetical protein
VNETFFDNEPFIAKQTLFLRHDFVNRIVFNLIGLDWILRIIGKSFLYVKEKVAQCYGRIIYVLCVKIICGQRGVEGGDRKRGRYEPS